jgi:hypothetical protein
MSNGQLIWGGGVLQVDPFTAERYSPHWMNWVELFLLLDRTYVGVRQLLISYCRYSYILQTLASGFLPKVLNWCSGRRTASDVPLRCLGCVLSVWWWCLTATNSYMYAGHRT